ncbi:MAG: hypothetical protein NXI20_05240 [bacterium]|nr:hypothetical protein [bacterium]
MSLIFFKTHLKDNSLLAERDRRLQSGFIGDIYNWQEFHHTHCIIRSHYTKAVIEPDVYGTLLLFPALTIEGRTGFDYFDNHASQSVMLQCGDFYLVTILNDSSMSYEIFKEDLHRINGPITPFQAREILAHLGFINLSLADRPKYISKFSPKNEYRITANLPSKITLKAPSESDLTPGKFLHYSVKNMIDVENKDQILQEILEGKRNYLFNEEGKFINHENNSY